MPTYLVQILMDELGGVEAAQQLAAVSAALAPSTTPASLRQYRRQLERAAYGPPPAAAPLPKERIDPSAAEEWFRARGIRVVKSG